MRKLVIFALIWGGEAFAEGLTAERCPELGQAPAGVQKDRPQAQESFLRGREYYEREHYEKAAQEFVDSYFRAADKEQDELLWNIALAYDRVGQRDKALIAYRCYLAGARDPKERMNVEARIAVLENLSQEPTEPEGELLQTQSEELPEAPPKKTQIAHWLVGGTVALGLAGVGLGVAANLREDDLADSCGQTAVGCSENEISGAKRLATAANVLYVLTAVAAIPTIGILVWELKENQVQAALVPVGRGAAVQVRW